jgi:hypothetical protein
VLGEVREFELVFLLSFFSGLCLVFWCVGLLLRSERRGTNVKATAVS